MTAAAATSAVIAAAVAAEHYYICYVFGRIEEKVKNFFKEIKKSKGINGLHMHMFLFLKRGIFVFSYSYFFVSQSIFFLNEGKHRAQCVSCQWRLKAQQHPRHVYG